jgi:hypothetical protein
MTTQVAHPPGLSVFGSRLYGVYSYFTFLCSISARLARKKAPGSRCAARLWVIRSNSVRLPASRRASSTLVCTVMSAAASCTHSSSVRTL